MLTIILAALMAADFITFLFIVPMVGISAELNPVMRYAYGYSAVLVGVLKLAALALILILANRLKGNRKRVALIIACSITVVGVLGNVSSFMVI
jgi:hypothetical protein